MIDIIEYLLSASGIMALLYILHRVFFSTMTFHTVNRIVLLAILPLSLVLPHISIEMVAITPITNEVVPHIFNDFGSLEDTSQVPLSKNIEWNWGLILGIIYGTGAILSVLKFGMNLFRLTKIKPQSIQKSGQFLIIIANVPEVFSYFKRIYIPDNGVGEINSSIIMHEKHHGQAWHTIDLVLCELYLAVFWFNPFVYLFRKTLKSVHEFQVDSMVLQTGIKKSDYLQLLLDNMLAKQSIIGVYNYFNGLTIKKRVTMMTKNRSSKWQLFRYLLILPAIAIMTMSFSSTPNSEGDIPSISPIKAGEYDRISSGYGMRMHPIKKKEMMHNGIDIVAKTGTPIISTADGVVTKVELSQYGHGKMVIVNHGGGYETWYTQMSDYAVKKGDKVKRGQKVGYVGSSGISTGSHLHYELHKDGKAVNPEDYIK